MGQSIDFKKRKVAVPPQKNSGTEVVLLQTMKLPTTAALVAAQ